MKIRAYLKPSCGWSRGVRAIFAKYGLEYDDIDIINSRENYAEMVQKSGQPLSPCVELDGVMLADISGEEVEQYMLANNLVNVGSKAVAPDNPPICAGAKVDPKPRARTVRRDRCFFIIVIAFE